MRDDTSVPIWSFTHIIMYNLTQLISRLFKAGMLMEVPRSPLNIGQCAHPFYWGLSQIDLHD